MLVLDEKHEFCVAESPRRKTQTFLPHFELMPESWYCGYRVPFCGKQYLPFYLFCVLAVLVSHLPCWQPGCTSLPGALPVTHLGFSDVSSEVRQAGPRLSLAGSQTQKTIDSCCSKCFSLCTPLSSDRLPSWGWEQHGAPRCLCCSAMCFLLFGVSCAFLTSFECHAEPQGNPQRSGRRDQAGEGCPRTPGKSHPLPMSAYEDVQTRGSARSVTAHPAQTASTPFRNVLKLSASQ